MIIVMLFLVLAVAMSAKQGITEVAMEILTKVAIVDEEEMLEDFVDCAMIDFRPLVVFFCKL